MMNKKINNSIGFGEHSICRARFCLHHDVKMLLWKISIKTIHFSVGLIKYFSFTTNKYFGERSHQKQYSGNPNVRDLSNVERVLLGFTFASANSPISASYKYYNKHNFLKTPLRSNASYMYCTICVFKPDCVA